jgi:hypothetical protein
MEIGNLCNEGKNSNEAIGVTWLTTLGGGGGQDRPWVLGTLRRGLFRKRGKINLKGSLIYTSLPPLSAKFIPLFKLVAKKLFLGIKNTWRGI